MGQDQCSSKCYQLSDTSLLPNDGGENILPEDSETSLPRFHNRKQRISDLVVMFPDKLLGEGS